MPPDFGEGKAVDAKRKEDCHPDDAIKCGDSKKIPLSVYPTPELHKSIRSMV